MTILLINPSIRGEESISRTLSTKLAKKLSELSNAEIVERDLTQEIHFVSSESFAAAGTVAEDRTPEQNEIAKLSDKLIDELQEADTIVFGAPIYNFGPPASLKAWADLVARAGTTFKYTENGPVGLLENKKAYIVGVSGGTPIGADFDFMSSWLKFFLGFIGISDVEIIAADGIMSKDGQEKIQAANDLIENMVA